MGSEPDRHFLTGEKGDRRSFFRSTVGRLSDELSRRMARRVAPERYVRPPGALDGMAFLAACTRCGECIDVCPVDAIQRAPPSAGLAAGTPIIDPIRQPCTVCPDMPCVAACEPQALVWPARGWEDCRLGQLELLPERCIAFHGSECRVCGEACPIGERALGFDVAGRPVIRAEGCVGCGVCVRACVTEPSSLILHAR